MNHNESIPLIFMTIVLLTGAAWDLRCQKIPNWLTFSALATAIVYHTGAAGWSGFLFSLAGAGLGLAMLFPFFLRGGMGAGDVKLLGAIGGLLGPRGTFIAFLFTALVGGIYALCILAARGCLKPTIRRYKMILGTYLLTWNFNYIPPPPEEQKQRLVYGLAIALGTLLSIGFEGRIL